MWTHNAAIHCLWTKEKWPIATFIPDNDIGDHWPQLIHFLHINLLIISKLDQEKSDKILDYFSITKTFYSLQHSLELMSAAESRSGGEFLHQREKVRVADALKSAKKDNDFIYHAIVPDVKSLPAIGKAVVAKPIPIAGPMSSKFTGKLLTIKSTKTWNVAHL